FLGSGVGAGGPLAPGLSRRPHLEWADPPAPRGRADRPDLQPRGRALARLAGLPPGDVVDGPGRAAATGRQGRLQQGQRLEHVPTPDEEVPERLELLPPARVRDVAQPASEVLLGGAAQDRPPTVEVAVGPPVSGLK